MCYYSNRCCSCPNSLQVIDQLFFLDVQTFKRVNLPCNITGGLNSFLKSFLPVCPKTILLDFEGQTTSPPPNIVTSWGAETRKAARARTAVKEHPAQPSRFAAADLTEPHSHHWPVFLQSTQWVFSYDDTTFRPHQTVRLFGSLWVQSWTDCRTGGRSHENIHVVAVGSQCV